MINEVRNFPLLHVFSKCLQYAHRRNFFLLGLSLFWLYFRNSNLKCRLRRYGSMLDSYSRSSNRNLRLDKVQKCFICLCIPPFLLECNSPFKFNPVPFMMPIVKEQVEECLVEHGWSFLHHRKM